MAVIARIPGLSASRRPELLLPEVIDRVVSVSGPDTLRMYHEIASVHGLIVGGSTGTVTFSTRGGGRIMHTP